MSDLDEKVQQAFSSRSTGFQPSRYIEDAWKVVEKMHQKGFETFALHATVKPDQPHWDLYRPGPIGQYTARFAHSDGREATAEATTAQEAICLACLAALATPEGDPTC